ncbi:hypothetical protein [Actinomadura kijaniata]|uniref:hypothetical protein n=1 Tax=Actinomadura kijaniata TaxID=46161 RepID=UPI0008372D67|nr:hypothetical protein [Actinomadura kijaniata]
MHALLARTSQVDVLWRRLLDGDPGRGLVRAVVAWSAGAALSDAELRRQMVRAQRDAADVGLRERSLVHAFHLCAHRHHRAAATHLARHLDRFAADPLAVPLLGAFEQAEDTGLIEQGRALIARQHTLAGPDQDWAWAAALAAVRAEQHRLDEAERLARHALRVQPRSGPAAHALAHVMHLRGAAGDYVAFIDAWLLADPHVPQRPHLQWHAALQCLADGDVQQARHRADTELAAGDVGMRSQVNWRLLLTGHTPARTVEADHARRLLTEPGGMVSIFHTFQLALALAVAGDTPALDRLARTTAADPRPAWRQVLTPVVQALAAMTNGHPGRAALLLEPLRQQITELGGVTIEREVINDTLARSLLLSGRPDQAADLLHHRRTTRTHHHYEDLLLNSVTRSTRSDGQTGDVCGAADHMHAAVDAAQNRVARMSAPGPEF